MDTDCARTAASVYRAQLTTVESLVPPHSYCRELDDRMLEDMVGKDGMNRAVAAWPDVQERAAGYESSHRVAECALPCWHYA